jgi:hypothetical protein
VIEGGLHRGAAAAAATTSTAAAPAAATAPPSPPGLGRGAIARVLVGCALLAVAVGLSFIVLVGVAGALFLLA